MKRVRIIPDAFKRLYRQNKPAWGLLVLIWMLILWLNWNAWSAGWEYGASATLLTILTWLLEVEQEADDDA